MSESFGHPWEKKVFFVLECLLHQFHAEVFTPFHETVKAAVAFVVAVVTVYDTMGALLYSLQAFFKLLAELYEGRTAVVRRSSHYGGIDVVQFVLFDERLKGAKKVQALSGFLAQKVHVIVPL